MMKKGGSGKKEVHLESSAGQGSGRGLEEAKFASPEANKQALDDEVAEKYLESEQEASIHASPITADNMKPPVAQGALTEQNKDPPADQQSIADAEAEAEAADPLDHASPELTPYDESMTGGSQQAEAASASNPAESDVQTPKPFQLSP